MSAAEELVPVPRGLRVKPREIRLPVSAGLQEQGFHGPLVEDANDDDLRKCLRDDRAFLFGGTRTDDRGEQITTRGVLGDASLNPRGHGDPDSYLGDVENTEHNRLNVYRVWRRVRATEAELERRRQQQVAQQQRTRESSRAMLAAFLGSVPSLVEQFEERAEAVAAAEAIIRPIADALVTLMSNYPSPDQNLPEAHAVFASQVANAANALGRAPPELPPLPPLPSFDGVRRMAAAVRGEVGPAALPKTGTERVVFERVLREVRG